MSTAEAGTYETVVIERDDTALNAAKLMRRHRVANVLIIGEYNGARIPVGIITERDLVVEIMAPELDYTVITAGDIIDLHTI
ncbi:MAG: CBS domain-containing protein [Gallionella sp.]|nr:CBS domain-containing protein [Gallionella sp.]